MNCPHNRHLCCEYRGPCPIGGAWYEKLLTWALTGRTPRTTDWLSPPAMNPDSSSLSMERTVQMAVLFRDPFAVLTFLDGNVPITRDVCMDISRARWLWSEAQLGYYTSRLEAAGEYDKRHCTTCGSKKPCGVHSKTPERNYRNGPTTSKSSPGTNISPSR